MREHEESNMTATTPRSRVPLARALRTVMGALCAAIAISLALAATAQADFGIEPGSFVADVSTLQAGAHPDAITEFGFRTLPGGAPDGSVRDVQLDLPAGLVGDPVGIERCRAEFLTPDALQNGRACPRSSMVGYARVWLKTLGIFDQIQDVPVYNLVPTPDQPAAFGFNVGGFSITRLNASVLPNDDYRLRIDVRSVSQAMTLVRTRVVFWGVPADHSGPGPEFFASGQSWGGSLPGARLPFMTNPSECGRPGTTTLRVRSWEDASAWHTAVSEPRTVTGCDRLAFEPTLDMRPESPRAGEPAPYSVDLAIPQVDVPEGTDTPPLRDIAVTLPQGVSVSPSSAQGLVGCTDQQAGFGSNDAAQCPNGSKIGTVSIDTPLMPDPLQGAVFLGQPKNMNAQTGEMLRIFIVASQSGVTIKLEGRITPDPTTGQLRAVFVNNPQLPFSLLRLRFQGGPRAPLTNPPTCGTYTTTSSMTSWGGNVASTSSSFVITENANGTPCSPQGFSPSFSAGMLTPVGGKASTFQLQFGRADTDQDLRDITIQMPPGLTGVIAQTPLCPAALAAAGQCAEASRIGSVVTGAGAGPNPLYLQGEGVYLTEGYKGGQFGLSIVVPAVAGPFDLGNVVVQSAIFVDRTDASLRIAADPLPTILQGIPLRVRDVRVSIDKPGFMLNPTNCSPTSVGGVISSVANAISGQSTRFQVANCAALPLKPTMELRVGGRGRVRRGITTPLTVTLRQSAGQANLKYVSVTLPRSLNARLAVVNRACTLAEYNADTCGAGALIGNAVAKTPLLVNPLSGPVYFVRNPARRLPDMMVKLRGQVAIDLVGIIRIPNDTLQLQTRFEQVPDVPISEFTLSLVAGRQGPVGNVDGLCTDRAKRAPAQLLYTGQNGKRITRNQRLTISGCGRTTTRAGSRRAGSRRAGSRRAGSRRGASRRGGSRRAGSRRGNRRG